MPGLTHGNYKYRWLIADRSGDTSSPACCHKAINSFMSDFDLIFTRLDLL